MLTSSTVKHRRAIQPLARKIATILVLYVILQIPLCHVDQLVEERAAKQNVAAVEEVARGWGGETSVATPVILRADGSYEYPTDSKVTVRMETQVKDRGSFQIPVYTAHYRIEVKFAANSEKGRLRVALKSPSSVHEASVIDSLLSEKLPTMTTGQSLEAELRPSAKDRALIVEVRARGTGDATYEALSDSETVQWIGDWPKPRFLNSYLPDATKLEGGGYKGEWRIKRTQESTRTPRVMGVSHIWEGASYPKVKRATHYGVFFIAITFLLIFFIEHFGKIAVHPIQYGFIGLAIALFYLLLLSASEVIGFAGAYWAATGAVTGLIVYYSTGFLKNRRFTVALFSEQVVSASFFYLILSLEERSLLVGSIGLFIVLAACMIFTRKIDWYESTLGTMNEDRGSLKDETQSPSS